MQANPFLGVLLHAIGGLAAASFYVPFRGVRKWSWETYWMVNGLFAWIIAPLAFAIILAPGGLAAIADTPVKVLYWAYFFGVAWGVGGALYGLTMRYLGIALGVSVALGFCAIFGTLMPPLFHGELGGILRTNGGRLIMVGVAMCLGGIIINGIAGARRDRELPEAQGGSAVNEFSLVKGLVVAVLSGILSASMSYGIDAGKPLAAFAVDHGVADIYKNLVVLVVVLLGGFTSNTIYCAFLAWIRGSGKEYLSGSAIAVKGEKDRAGRVPRFMNYTLCALAGVTWYIQFYFYSMGTTKMGRYDFSSWTLHMSSIILFGTLWGLALKEWRGVGKTTSRLVALGLVVLIASIIMVGWGSKVASETKEKAPVALEAAPPQG